MSLFKISIIAFADVALVAGVVISICAGCGAPPRIASLSESSIVLAFGDSLTFGEGVNREASYPSVLSDLIGCRVVNSGVPGEDTSEGLRRLPAVMDTVKPDLVILCEGGNDMLKKQSKTITRRNLDGMITMVKERGVDVILVGVPKLGLFLKSPSYYQELADKHQVPLDSATVAEILRTPSLKSDHIHPNSAGYEMMARRIAELIRKSQR